MESTRVRHLRQFINVTCFVFPELEHPVQVIFLMRMCMPSSLVVSKTTRKADNVTVDEEERHVPLWSITWSMLG